MFVPVLAMLATLPAVEKVAVLPVQLDAELDVPKEMLVPPAVDAGTTATASVDMNTPPTDATNQAPASPGPWQRYTDYFDGWIEKALVMPLWGNTGQLPKGMLKVKYGIVVANADTYLNSEGEPVTLIPPITINDFPDPGDELVIDPRVNGGGAEHTLDVSYGITDAFDVFVKIPFTSADTELALHMRRNGEDLDPLTRGFFESFLMANGRPLPGEGFNGSMDLGDMRTGVSWNPFRNEYLSVALTPAVTLPTGTPANPNNDLTFLLGPEIDRGMGAWAGNLNSSVDIRPVRWLIFSFDVGASYRFGYERKSPKWLAITDCARLSDADERTANRCSAGSAPFDPSYDRDQSEIFPNMAALESTYRVKPALSTTVQAGVTFDIFGAGLSGTWQFVRNEAPLFDAADTDAGRTFEQWAKSLEMFAASEVHVVVVAAQIPLFPLYLPLRITPNARWIVAGRNTVRLDNQYGMTIEGFIPVNDFF